MSVVLSTDIYRHVQKFNGERIKDLTVDVSEGGWERGRMPTDYRLDTLETLVLRSTHDNTALDRNAPHALIQWMPQLRVLDISNLEHLSDFMDVYNTFPRQRLEELILGSMGLRVLYLLLHMNNDDDDQIHLLSSVQSVKCIVKAHLTIPLLSWLRKWVPREDNERRHRLILVFPMWNAHIHTHMITFYEAPMQSCKLELDVRVLGFDHTCNDIPHSPFRLFHGMHTPIRFTFRIENMGWMDSRWLDVTVEPLSISEADTYIHVDLIFTDDWVGFNPDIAYVMLDCTQLTIKQLVMHHIHKWEHSILPQHYYGHTNQHNLMDIRRTGVKTQLVVTIHTPKEHTSEIAPILSVSFDDPNQQMLYESLLTWGDIKYEMDTKGKRKWS